ncbi:MAG: GNAT family N-acetyltransferase [Bacteroidetes bacterium]|nr:GNAT family N-acetyltransferase [Bacteroidota bacterium]
MNIHLRPMTLADADAVCLLTGQLGYPSGAVAMQQRIAAVLDHPDHCLYVALADERVVGWIHGFYTLTLESGPFVAIAGLVVDENCRRSGVGKALVRQVAAWPAAQRCGRVRVRCNAVRTESHWFYQALGFREVKEQKVFDWALGAS